jgi:hypothetical protein
MPPINYPVMPKQHVSVAVLVIFAFVNFYGSLQKTEYPQSKEVLDLSELKHQSGTDIDTAIVISSSWIPIHPSTNMTDKVIESISKLRGLR